MIFHNKDLDKKFKKKGYVIIDLLSEDESTNLLDFYNTIEHFHSKPSHFIISKEHAPQNVQDEIYKKLTSVIQPQINTHVNAYLPFFTNYMVKYPDKFNSGMHLHQDYTYVDESTHTTINVWIALHNMSKSEGSLSIVPYSHHYGSIYRGRGFNNNFNDKEFILKRLSKTPRLKKGQAILFNTALIHNSYNNRSQNPRYAISYLIYPKDAQLIQYELKENQLIEHQVNRDFFRYESTVGKINNSLKSKQIKQTYSQKKIGIFNILQTTICKKLIG